MYQSKLERPLSKLPRTLKEMLDFCPGEYHLTECHYLELVHGLMGFFPAIIRGSGGIVLTTDRALLYQVWKTLPPRDSKMVSFACYLNERTGTAFPYPDGSNLPESIKPIQILSREEFEVMTAGSNRKLFDWAPGLIGPNMTRQEFMRTIEAVARANRVSPA